MNRGDQVWFEEEKRPYTVRAVSADKRWVVCTKPFTARHAVLYTVVDFVDQVRGVDNLVFSIGYETDEQCRESLKMFESGGAAHSRRHPPIPLKIRKVKAINGVNG